jgi:mannose-6-phosphate isomerase-like protein (cupin superfamily)
MQIHHTMVEEMPSNIRQPRPSYRLLGLGLLCGTLALGWLGREAVFAKSVADKLKSGTVNLGEVQMGPHKDGDKVVGQAGVYFSGDTAASSKFVTGRYVLPAGKSPHAPHTHIEEEVMVIESGTGEIFCDGKTTKIGPGSTMYTAANVSHGIVNTGETPIVFYFIKWAPANAQ